MSGRNHYDIDIELTLKLGIVAKLWSILGVRVRVRRRRRRRRRRTLTPNLTPKPLSCVVTV